MITERHRSLWLWVLGINPRTTIEIRVTRCSTSMKPDLTHIETWIFDLDNTLYSASTHLFGQIDVRMKAFIGRELNLSPDDAHTLQKRYYREHGTTLRGLMINHKIDPDAFLDFVHDIDHAVLAPVPDLTMAL